MIRLVAVPIRIVFRLMVFYLVIIGLVTTGGFAGVGPLADELATDDAPLDETTVDSLVEWITDSAGMLTDSAGEFTRQPVDQNATAADEPAVERLIHEEINEERTAKGLDPLQRDADLRHVARNHSADMVRQGYVGHESPDGVTPGDRLSAAGCAAGGENVAQSWIDEPVNVDGETIVAENETELAVHLVERWMDSPGHRENILRESFAESGVGVVVTDDNRVYATQNFCAGSAGALF